ncbi:MAG TPA: V-type ATPase subunit, partial [Syntrophorhabdaceae bacterium]|nr:V-type ATPase subunit [Syntrophorhabdaceae bacterium]
MTGNLDYFVARLHGKRSSMAEGDRLDSLTRLRSLQEFTRAIFPEREFQRTTDFQRQLIEELAREFSGFPGHLDRAQKHVVDWMPARLEAENIKVLLRACITRINLEDVMERLVPLPGQTPAVVESLVRAPVLTDFVKLLPFGPLRKGLEKAIGDHGEDARPFFLEAALDSAYLEELIARLALLSNRDRQESEGVICQEADIFHLMLVLRGKFNYGLAADQLLSFHVPGARISRALLAAMLDDHDPWIAVGRAVMRAIDPLPVEGALSESSSA